MPEPVAISLNNVNKIYRLYDSVADQALDVLGLSAFRFWRPPRYREFPALRGVNLEVRRGERIGVLGRNGAGKTTLLKLITGNFGPTAGEVVVRGSVQALMQAGLGFHPEFSGYENIRAALNYNGLAGRDFEESLQDVTDFVELGDFLHQPLKTYSQGMAARLQFAAATAIRPDILIVDEILGAGDAYFSGKCAYRMQKLTSSGCTLLLVSHSTQQILQFCSKAVWLEQGRIQMVGDALDVVKAYEEFIEHLHQAHRSGEADRTEVKKTLLERKRRDFATADWQKERMVSLLVSRPGSQTSDASATSLSRWPAEKGLKIVGVEVFDQTGTVVDSIKSGTPLEIEVEIVAEHEGEFEFRVVILLMTLDGIALTRHLSDQFVLCLTTGETRCVRLRYGTTFLARGEFVFSAALFKKYDPDDSTTAVRYDLLSRSFKLTVVPRHASEPGLFNHPSDWKVLPPMSRTA